MMTALVDLIAVGVQGYLIATFICRLCTVNCFIHSDRQEDKAKAVKILNAMTEKIN